ncbi:hypothetical protein B0T21DRAFT_353014 [Apiosordaria backusii]|uniref:Uncharacterized protein n=1 Tax=Apiosordaria backusii TaxID=314023 RepID=A0AA40DL45_9PEZI|nr:hypothetical protein B0T21DRAFT_353014 [Apiosordaria backusii]
MSVRRRDRQAEAIVRARLNGYVHGKYVESDAAIQKYQYRPKVKSSQDNTLDLYVMWHIDKRVDITYNKRSLRLLIIFKRKNNIYKAIIIIKRRLLIVEFFLNSKVSKEVKKALDKLEKELLNLKVNKREGKVIELLLIIVRYRNKLNFKKKTVNSSLYTNRLISNYCKKGIKYRVFNNLISIYISINNKTFKGNIIGNNSFYLFIAFKSSIFYYYKGFILIILNIVITFTLYFKIITIKTKALKYLKERSIGL